MCRSQGVMPSVPYHQPCPDRPGHSLSEHEKRRGARLLKRVRYELCQYQLAPLWREHHDLVRQCRGSARALHQLRLRIRLRCVERRMQAIRQRWLFSSQSDARI